MDRRFMKGRLALVALVAVLCIAIPAAAFAASSNNYPSGPTAQPSVVGVTFTGVAGQTAVITVDGTAIASKIAKGTSVTGTWNVQDVLVGAVTKSQWVWVAGAGAEGQIKVYGFPTTLAAGSHAVVVTLKDGNGATTDSASWSFSVDLTIPVGGSDLPGTIVAAPDCGAVCHPNYNKKPAMGPKCSACHYGADAPDPSVHNFAQGTASGHNTTMYGTVGAHTKWDGSEGVVVKSTQETTITQEWPLPTASVFWSQSNLGSLSPTDSPLVAMNNRGFASAAAGAAAINTSVGWGSVVSCTDCHTNMDQTLGPQGANAGAVSLDPNFPDDWTKAELTSFDPTGMRKIDTVRDTPNPYYTKLGSNVYMPAEVENAADPLHPFAGMSIETTTQKVYGSVLNAGNVPGYSSTATTVVYPGGFYGLTDQPSSGYSMGDSTGRFICQKCHKLTNSFQGLGIEGNGRGARDNNLNYMGMSNEAHMEHHNDMVTGQGNCVSCHAAIPHGWKRPRLLVYDTDPAPYKVQNIWPDYRSTDVTGTLRNMAPTNLYTDGNWGFLSNPTATLASRYGDLTTTNPYTGALTSSHLEKLDASAEALKELAVGPAEEFEEYDAQSAATNFASKTGINVAWGGWDMAAEGVEYLGNPNGYTISSTVWNGATNSPMTIQEAPIQNNCNACTSAGIGTHAPQVGANTGGEGIKATLPAWK